MFSLLSLYAFILRGYKYFEGSTATAYLTKGLYNKKHVIYCSLPYQLLAR